MYRTDARGEVVPLEPGGLMPRGMCQPPVDAMKLMEQLSPQELRDVAHTMIIWAPEAFEKGLQRVSANRKIRGWYTDRPVSTVSAGRQS
jgi:hypothetical protein